MSVLEPAPQWLCPQLPLRPWFSALLASGPLDTREAHRRPQRGFVYVLELLMRIMLEIETEKIIKCLLIHFKSGRLGNGNLDTGNEGHRSWGQGAHPARAVSCPRPCALLPGPGGDPAAASAQGDRASAAPRALSRGETEGEGPTLRGTHARCEAVGATAVSAANPGGLRTSVS